VAALAVDGVRRAGPRVLPGAVLLVLGGRGVVVDHIFWPWGALGAGLIGLGTAVLDDPRLRSATDAGPETRAVDTPLTLDRDRRTRTIDGDD
jgi:hypothetical protein